MSKSRSLPSDKRGLGVTEAWSGKGRCIGQVKIRSRGHPAAEQIVPLPRALSKWHSSAHSQGSVDGSQAAHR